MFVTAIVALTVSLAALPFTALAARAASRQARAAFEQSEIQRQLMQSGNHHRFAIKVDAEDPSGPLPTLEIEVDLLAWCESRDAPEGSLHHVRGEIKKPSKAADRVNRTLSAFSTPDPLHRRRVAARTASPPVRWVAVTW